MTPDVPDAPVRKGHILVLAGAALLTIPATWPLLLELGSYSRVSDQPRDDQIFYWGFWWVHRAIVVLQTNPLFCGEIFHPTGASIVASPLALPVAFLSVPFQMLLGTLFGTILALKLTAFLTFPLAVHGTWLLLREFRVAGTAAFLAGCLYAFAPFKLLHLPRIHYLAGCLLPYCLWLLVLLCRSPSTLRYMAIALVIAIMGAWDPSLLPELAFASAALLLCLIFSGVSWKRVVFIGSSGLLAGILALSPLLIAFLSATSDNPDANVATRMEFEGRPQPGQLTFAPDLNVLSYYLGPALHETLVDDDSALGTACKHIRAITRSMRPAGPMPMVGALAGAVTILLGLACTLRGTRRRELLPFLALALLGFTLAMGPYRNFGDDVIRMPYYYLSQAVPGMKAGRYPATNIRLFLLGISVVAAAGLQGRCRWLPGLGWATLGLTVVAWCARPFQYEPFVAEPIYEIIQQDPVPGAVLELPECNRSLRLKAMGQVLHERPLKGGPIHRVADTARGFWDNVPFMDRLAAQPPLRQKDRPDPPAVEALRKKHAAETDENVRLLREHGVRFVVIRSIDIFQKRTRFAGVKQYLELHRGLTVQEVTPGTLLVRVEEP